MGQKRGLFFDKRLERKKVDGVYGMYAKEHIPADTICVSYPVNKLLPNDRFADSNLPPQIRIMGVVAEEMQKGEASDFYGCFAMFDSYEYLKETSIYFYDEQDFEVLQAMSPILAKLIRSTQGEMKQFASLLKGIIPDADDALVDHVVLNHVSRGWRNLGFVPIVDLFNHSDIKGSKLKIIRDGSGQDRVGWVTKVAYERGEQIYANYSCRGMVSTATKYNYFDPSGTHYIDMAPRVLQPIDSPFKEKLCTVLSQKYQSQLVQVQGKKHFKLYEDGLFFTQHGPSPKLIDYFREYGIENEQEFAAGRCSDQKALTNMLAVIDAFLEANKSDEFELGDIPEKLHRFYHLLKKEKLMLTENREWVIDNLAG